MEEFDFLNEGSSSIPFRQRGAFYFGEIREQVGGKAKDDAGFVESTAMSTIVAFLRELLFIRTNRIKRGSTSSQI